MPKLILVASSLALLWSGVSGAQSPDSTAAPPLEPGGYSAQPSGAAPAASASIANPAISVIGWFQAVSGNDPGAQEKPFELREAELAFQSLVDPFARADFFLSASAEGLDLEEGYLTWLALPGGGQAKLGKFRADLGKFNRTHPPETPFADRPLAAGAFLGAEGLSTTGISASALIPNPAGLYWELVANLGSVPEAAESPLFEAESRSDLLAVGRTSWFVPLRESTDLNLGVSYANASAPPSLRPEGSRAQLGTVDVTLRWKNPRRSIYRSLLAQAELTAERGSAAGSEHRGGGFGYVIYQVARQWKVGARYDWTERPDTPERESGGLALIQYQPSEFSTLSLQARHVRDAAADRDLDAAFFKWTFNIGPHGAHPY
ncbi:MAG TPA: hypothetical protein VGK93_04840 [Candidatus Eisenbacteria bacterium]|jgi:hypothetical protein